MNMYSFLYKGSFQEIRENTRLRLKNRLLNDANEYRCVKHMLVYEGQSLTKHLIRYAIRHLLNEHPVQSPQKVCRTLIFNNLELILYSDMKQSQLPHKTLKS
jgi:hypothetical protein